MRQRLPQLTTIWLALLLLWPMGPALAEPDSLDAVKQRLLKKELFEIDDIPDLIRLRQAGGDLDPGLSLPDPWQRVIIQGLARVQMAWMVQNYVALIEETERLEWLIALSRAMEEALPQSKDAPRYSDLLEALRQDCMELQNFARQRLRILDPAKLTELVENPLFTGTPADQAQLDLLAARIYLDQGENIEFEKSLASLAAFALKPSAPPPLTIGYYCLARHSMSSPATLEETLDHIIAVAENYRPGTRPDDDTFWTVADDELEGLTIELLSTYHYEKDPTRTEALLKYLQVVNKLAYDWFATVVEEDPDLFSFPLEIFFEPGKLERRRGMFALFLTSEKLIRFLDHFKAALKGPKGSQRVREDLALYRGYREGLDGFWLEVPSRVFPTQGDFWVGSALQRLEIGLKVQLWIIEPQKDTVPALVEEVLSLSPVEGALDLAISWSDNLIPVDPQSVQQLLSRAQTLAQAYRLPAYTVLIAEQLVIALDAENETKQAIKVAEHAIAASGDLAALSIPVSGGRTMGEVVKDLSEYIAVRRIQSGDAAAAQSQLDQGQAIQSALQLSKDASRSRGEVATILQEVSQARAQEDRQARSQAIGVAASTVGTDKGKFLASSRELQAKYPELYDRTLSIKPVEFPRLQKHLPDEVVLLQYFPTDTVLYIFAITREDLLLEQVDITKADLDASLLSYLRSLRRVSEEASFKDASRKLYAHLVAPIEQQLNGKSTILLVPSGRLNYLPFASLIDSEGQVLAENYQFSILGKSSDLIDVLLSSPQVGSSIVVVADPAGDLPAARQEGETLAGMFPGSLALYRDKATQEALSAGLGSHPYLHLATHGEIDSGNPSLNYLLLASGQRLTAEDIFSLPLEAVQMVTLSACNTALGEGEPTASVISLAENFWVTGPDSVVATLWAVNDQSTAVFMEEFYRAIRSGDGKAKAMQRAQRNLRENPKFAHPYYWSPFVLLGDWR